MKDCSHPAKGAGHESSHSTLKPSIVSEPRYPIKILFPITWWCYSLTPWLQVLQNHSSNECGCYKGRRRRRERLRMKIGVHTFSKKLGVLMIKLGSVTRFISSQALFSRSSLSDRYPHKALLIFLLSLPNQDLLSVLKSSKMSQAFLDNPVFPKT